MRRTFLSFSLYFLSISSLAADEFSTALSKYKKEEYVKAFDLFEISCNNGNYKSCYNLSVMHKYGQGTLINRNKAKFFLQKACEYNRNNCNFDNIANS